LNKKNNMVRLSLLLSLFTFSFSACALKEAEQPNLLDGINAPLTLSITDVEKLDTDRVQVSFALENRLDQTIMGMRFRLLHQPELGDMQMPSGTVIPPSPASSLINATVARSFVIIFDSNKPAEAALANHWRTADLTNLRNTQFHATMADLVLSNNPNMIGVELAMEILGIYQDPDNEDQISVYIAILNRSATKTLTGITFRLLAKPELGTLFLPPRLSTDPASGSIEFTTLPPKEDIETGIILDRTHPSESALANYLIDLYVANPNNITADLSLHASADELQWK
jgi:hypothetical protein